MSRACGRTFRPSCRRCGSSVSGVRSGPNGTSRTSCSPSSASRSSWCRPTPHPPPRRRGSSLMAGTRRGWPPSSISSSGCACGPALRHGSATASCSAPPRCASGRSAEGSWRPCCGGASPCTRRGRRGCTHPSRWTRRPSSASCAASTRARRGSSGAGSRTSSRASAPRPRRLARSSTSSRTWGGSSPQSTASGPRRCRRRSNPKPNLPPHPGPGPHPKPDPIQELPPLQLFAARLLLPMLQQRLLALDLQAGTHRGMMCMWHAA